MLSSPGAVKTSAAPDAKKPLQTTLNKKKKTTSLLNLRFWENSMSFQGTPGPFSSRSVCVEHSASSSLILAPSKSFQSKRGHFFHTNTSPSFQAPTGLAIAIRLHKGIQGV